MNHKTKSNIPCHNCLIYPLCRQQLINEFKKLLMMTQMFHEYMTLFHEYMTPSDQALYKAYTQTLQHKCTLLCISVAGQRMRNVYAVERKTVELLKKAFRGLSDEL